MYRGTTTADVPIVQWNNSGAFFTFRSEIPYHFKLRIPELSLKNSEEGNWKEKILYNFFLLYAKKNSLNSSFWSHLFFLSGAKGILLVLLIPFIYVLMYRMKKRKTTKLFTHILKLASKEIVSKEIESKEENPYHESSD